MPNRSEKPAGRSALVTGASGGIGLACAQLLGERGYKITMVARSAPRLESAAGVVGADWLSLDCADETSVAQAAAELTPFDLVVHAVGTLHNAKASRQTALEFERVVHANLTSAYVVGSQFAQRMPAGSHIVFISSLAAFEPERYVTAYAAAKAGVRAMAEVLRAEHEVDGIGVHVVLPGVVDTEMMAATTIKRPALKARDIASAVAWLDELPVRVRVDEIVMRPNERAPTSHFIGSEASVSP